MSNKRPPSDRGLIPQLSETLQETVAAREASGESILKLWCERLGTEWSNRHNTLALDAAVSVMNADRANLQFAHGERLIIKKSSWIHQSVLGLFQGC